LIDEYSLKGAKGLLVNITGGNDLTMFEVDQITNKIRAEVDCEADLITGSIEDENLNGKIRVSIVATSLDAQTPQTKPVISMVHRLQNRNAGYSNNLTNTAAINQATLNATEGATALNINTDVEQENVVQDNVEQEDNKNSNNELSLENISMENAAYLQDMEDTSNNKDLPTFEVDSIELQTPELFSDNNEENAFNQDFNKNETEIFGSPESKEKTLTKEPEMFEESNLEEDFEIPAFLRRQKN
jgi:cell division protein FtsZ